MIIDVSNTLGRHRFKPEIKAEELLKEMDKNHIDMAVIHCYGESMDNESVYRAVTGHPDRFIGLYTVNPWSTDSAGELEEALKEKGFKGLYMDPVRHGYMLCEREVFYPLLDVCRKHQAPVWCYGAAEVFSNPVSLNRSRRIIRTSTLSWGGWDFSTTMQARSWWENAIRMYSWKRPPVWILIL